jgi:hypothetical protein
MPIVAYTIPKRSSEIRQHYTLKARRQAARCQAAVRFQQEHPADQVVGIAFHETRDAYLINYEWREPIDETVR